MNKILDNQVSKDIVKLKDIKNEDEFIIKLDKKEKRVNI